MLEICEIYGSVYRCFVTIISNATVLLVLSVRNDGYLETIGRCRRANIKQSRVEIHQCVSILQLETQTILSNHIGSLGYLVTNLVMNLVIH